MIILCGKIYKNRSEAESGKPAAKYDFSAQILTYRGEGRKKPGKMER